MLNPTEKFKVAILHMERPKIDWYVMTWSYLILRSMPAIHEINALREVLGQRMGKFLLKSIIALWSVSQ